MKADKVHIEDLLRQKKELEQSVKYASYIQKALLPTEVELRQAIPESFVYFAPRDVVSGDFYWFNRQKNYYTIAVGDCTGHGVPGAFLSVLGISFLNLVVSKHKPGTPADLLNYLREYVMKALNQTGQADEQKDSIDLSVCMINTETGTLDYSGSYNPIYIITSNDNLSSNPNSIVQLAGNKMPVGIDVEIEKSFTNKKYPLKKGDFIYLFTDGFPDQFGGTKGKKYKYPAFRKLLVNCSNLPVSEQKNYLKADLVNWKGAHNQLDDITILGLKY